MGVTSSQEFLTKKANEFSQLIYYFSRSSKIWKITFINAILLTIFNKGSIKLIKSWLDKLGLHLDFELPNYYTGFLLLLIVFLFIYSIILTLNEIKILRNRSKIVNPSVRSPIKGLLSFEAGDSELFKLLQRNNDIQQLKNSVLHKDFKFGILTAISGCGKTSLINAGLGPAINQENILCVIVTLTNEPIIKSILKSLKQSFEDFEIKNEESDIYSILQELIKKTQTKTVVIIFDQFEQFFTQNPVQKEREKYIRELKEVLTKLSSIKILISLRSDFLDGLRELQLIIGYTLDASRNYFTLSKFTASQAVAIFEIIAKNENIEFIDISFMEKIAREELASHDDGLISPVDIQIISLIVKNNKEGEISFNNKAFKQLGGIDGMLKRYVESQLAAPNSFNSKNAGLYVLLTLINLNKNVKAGQLSFKEIKDRVPLEITASDLEQLLIWLEQSKLIHSISNNPKTYEIGHERLIEPILNIHNNSNSKSRKANDLLERRSYEWVSNNRSSRYLFNLREYLLIHRHINLIDWQNNELQKKELLNISFKKMRLWTFVIITPFLLLSILYLVKTSIWYKVNFEVPQLIVNGFNKEFLEDDDDFNNMTEYLTELDTSLAFKAFNNLPNLNNRDQAYLMLLKKASNYSVDFGIGVIKRIDSKENKEEGYEELIYDIGEKDPILALSLIKRYISKENRQELINSLAGSVADKNLDWAIELLSKTNRTSKQLDWTYNGIIKNLTYRDPGKAINLLDSIKDKHIKDQCILAMIESLGSNELPLALQLITKIEDIKIRLPANISILHLAPSSSPIIDSLYTNCLTLFEKLDIDLNKIGGTESLIYQLKRTNRILSIPSVLLSAPNSHLTTFIYDHNLSLKAKSYSIIDIEKSIKTAEQISNFETKIETLVDIAQKNYDKNENMSDSLFRVCIRLANGKADQLAVVASSFAESKPNKSDLLFISALRITLPDTKKFRHICESLLDVNPLLYLKKGCEVGDRDKEKVYEKLADFNVKKDISSAISYSFNISDENIYDAYIWALLNNEHVFKNKSYIYKLKEGLQKTIVKRKTYRYYLNLADVNDVLNNFGESYDAISQISGNNNRKILAYIQLLSVYRKTPISTDEDF
jgi:hypothetical protein